MTEWSMKMLKILSQQLPWTARVVCPLCGDVEEWIIRDMRTAMKLLSLQKGRYKDTCTTCGEDYTCPTIHRTYML